MPEGFHEKALQVLRDLVRMDTTNPPGNEIACARYLKALLEPAGIETHIIEPAPGRGSLIARLRGSGEAAPLMIMGHLDVVTANPEEWRYPPFSAEIAEGFVWGRGTTDNKQMVAVGVTILLALAELEQPLKRDVILAATADEERGGRLGIGHVVREFPGLVRAACVLNEGGGAALRINDRLFFTCQTAEKGVCRTVWRVQGRSGHASQPRADLATFKLARAIARLGDGHLNGRAIETMRTALGMIASTLSAKAEKRVQRLLAQGQIEQALAEVGFEGESLARARPLFYDTASVTGLRAGDPESINVIPLTATAYVDGRILPGQTQEGFIESLRRCAGEEVEISLYREEYSPGLESPTEAPIVEVIRRVIAERCPGAMVIPWQCAGSTDAKHLVPRGIPVYGFIPALPLPEGVEGAGAHAHNERLWLDNLPFMFDILYDVTYRFCSEIS